MHSKIASSQLTRRRILQIGAGIAAGIPWLTRARTRVAEPDRQFQYGEPLSEFSYGQVQLRPGPHQAQLEQAHAVLMGLNEDSLLRPFRYAAGLPTPGFELGGWYSSNGRDPGHAFGQWVSALSRYYAITGDEQTQQKVHRLVAGFSETVEPSGKFYQNYTNPWATASEASYTYNLLIGGLVDAHEFARVPNALDTVSRVTDAALPHIPDRVFDTPAGFDWTFVTPHNLFLAWQRGARADHLQLAKRYLHNALFDPLARGQNVLGGRHAYSHLDALNSAAMAYLVLGDPLYLKAAVNGFGFVEQQSFATGGWGPNETFLPKPAYDAPDPQTGENRHHRAINTPADSIRNEHNHFETGCGSYTHFKLTRYLLRITKDARYGDSMERIMYNAALGMLPLNQFGRAFYQSNYSRYARKEYFDGYDHVMPDEWPCCSGTLTQLVADYRISSYFRDAKGVFVNLYIPSTLRWSQEDTDVSLSQEGTYPLSDRVAFTIAPARPIAFSLRFRVPAWARNPSLSVNNTSVAVKPGSFADIRRVWRPGDRVELKFPRELTLKPADDQQSGLSGLVALTSGPLVLFAIGEDLPSIHREQLLAATQASPGAAEWRAGAVHFRPWWIIKDETYTTYHEIGESSRQT